LGFPLHAFENNSLISLRGKKLCRSFLGARKKEKIPEDI